LILPAWAQSDTAFDHFLEFGNSTPDLTPHPFNIGSSSITYETQIDSDSPNSAALYMLPDSELAEVALVSVGSSPTVSNEKDGPTGSPEYELDQTLNLARPDQENVCRWPNCLSRFDQISEFR
jgi:hypothetical protein